MRSAEPLPRTHALTAAGVRSLQRGAGNAIVARLIARRPGRVLARDPEIEASEDAMGQRVVDNMLGVNDSSAKSATSGVFYPEDYVKLAATDDVARQFWREDHRLGYANPKYWERRSRMTWELKDGVDAAAAIKDWLAGLTIAECASVLVAIELDTMRAAVGDDRFNEMFSSLDQRKPERELLKLSWYSSQSSAKEFITRAAPPSGPQAVGSRSVKKGEWCAFCNHPKYLLKHPGGDWQGLNAICMDDTPGAQMYSGFGEGVVTEPEMLDTMARSYNETRSEYDYQVLVQFYAKDEAKAKTTSESWKDVWDGLSKWWWVRVPYLDGKFPDTITAQDILDASAYELDGVTRKGGFVSTERKMLDPHKVGGARGA